MSTAALRAVGNIVTGDDQQTQVILSYNALPCISHLLFSTAETIKKESCWTISNIAAGNREQIQAIISANIFPQLIKIMQTADFKTRKEAAWAITNATSSGTAEQIHYLVEIGCVPPMCDFLTVVDSDIVQVALNALENILKAGEKYQVRPNPYAMTIEECGGEFEFQSCTRIKRLNSFFYTLQDWTKLNIYKLTRIAIFITSHSTLLSSTLATRRRIRVWRPWWAINSTSSILKMCLTVASISSMTTTMTTTDTSADLITITTIDNWKTLDTFINQKSNGAAECVPAPVKSVRGVYISHIYPMHRLNYKAIKKCRQKVCAVTSI